MIDRPALLAVGTLLVAVGVCAFLPEALARRLLVEGRVVETLSALFAAGACVGLLRVLSVDRARRRGEAVAAPPTLLRDAVFLTLVGVFFAGEELSWGEDLWWNASFVAGRRIDAAHDVVSVLADQSTPTPFAVAFVAAAGGALLARHWLRRPAARWLFLSAAIYAGATPLDTLHLPGVMALAVEELGELWGAALLCAAAAVVHRQSETPT